MCIITFEGLDGSGKSTQSRLLALKLRDCGYDVIETREPGGTHLGEELRKLILSFDAEKLDKITELMIFLASRRQLISKIIKPNYNKKVIIIIDRFIDSTLAYQGYGRNIDKDIINKLNKFVLDDIEINLTFFMDVPPENNFKLDDESDRIEMESDLFKYRVYRGFCEIAQSFDRIYSINPSKNISTTAENIFNIVKEKLIFFKK